MSRELRLKNIFFRTGDQTYGSSNDKCQGKNMPHVRQLG